MTAEQSLSVQKGNASQTQAKIIIPEQPVPKRLASQNRYDDNDVDKEQAAWLVKLWRLVKNVVKGWYTKIK
jgi:hypothetical protein